MRWRVALAVLLLSLLAAHDATSATTIRVPQDFWTVQAAVNAAGPGDTVLVHPREYPEYVEIRAPGITLRGASGDPADVRITSIRLLETQDIRIEAVTLLASWRPLFVDRTTDAVVANVSFLDSLIQLGWANPQWGTVLFEDCDFGEARIEIKPGPFTCTIRDSRFGPRALLGNGGAIWVGNGSTLVVEGTVFYETQASGDGGAIYCGTGSMVAITRCTFARNWASGAGGAVFAGEASVAVSNSILFGAIQGEGIACSGLGSGVSVTHCILFANSHGDEVCGTDGGNLVLDPKLCNPLDPEALGLCADSPALAGSPDNPWGEDVGALGQECLCTVSVDPTTWGRLKGRYR